MSLKFRQAYASRLRQEREKKGLTKVQVAKVVGVSSKAYEHWENAERTPGFHKAYLLWKLFGIDFSQMEHLTNLYSKIHNAKNM